MGITTFRRPSARVAVVIIAVIAYFVLSFRIYDLADGLVEDVLAALLFVLLAVAVLQTWRLAVVVRSDGVLVRNSWRDQFLRWDDIQGIDHEQSRIQRVSILMNDGRVVQCEAMRGWATKDEPHAKALVQAVTERLAAREQQAG
ncbi:PH domain-containing protein [Lentzea sp. BCCO 10_0061]|uniref:PH domain-containing protein n=1 Tax=Lentzea sokolovensis TaxID=3095429 RepID=A0ABU4UXP5_9PSEU|nr:PH domain-containing protein [Lentzea sp. BCCO 10_0061]MDX8144307.1 PH domain-containing protein [Lentzea sp. BCCO 10_0061]